MIKVITIAILGVLSLASCKGDFTCECTTGDKAAIVTNSEIRNKTLSEATAECNSKSGSFAGIDKTCRIK